MRSVQILLIIEQIMIATLTNKSRSCFNQLSKSPLVLLIVLLLFARLSLSQLTLTNLAVGGTWSNMDSGQSSISGGGYSVLTNLQIKEATPFKWLPPSTPGVAAWIRYELPYINHVGSVIFVSNMSTVSSRHHISMWAGPGAISGNTMCNYGRAAAAHGAWNCVVPDAQYIHITWVATDPATDYLEWDEMLIHQCPDYAQHRRWISLDGGSFTQGSEDTLVGPYEGSFVSTPSTIVTGTNQIHILLNVELPNQIIYLLSTTGTASSYQFAVSLTTGAFQAKTTRTTNTSTLTEHESANRAENYWVTPSGSTFEINSIVILERYDECRCPLTLTMGQPDIAFTFPVGDPAVVYTYSIAAEPSWCTFTVGTLSLYNEATLETTYQGSLFTKSGADVSFQTSDTALIGSVYTVYVSATTTDGGQASPAPFLRITVGGPSDPCSSTVFQPVADPVVISQALDVTSQTHNVYLDNSYAISQLDPATCGGRTTTYIEDSTVATVTYVTLTETSNDYFQFIVSKPPQTVGIGTVSFTVSAFLTNYSTIVYSLPIQLTFTCPAVPELKYVIQESFATPFVYDLSPPTALSTYTVSQIELYPAGCAFTFHTVTEVTDVSIGDPLNGQSMDATMSYDIGLDQFSINVDTILNPEIVGGAVRRYTTYVYYCPDCTQGFFVDEFDVSFEYLGVNPPAECPGTSINTPIIDPAPVLHELVGPDTVISYQSQYDTVASSAAIPSLCGPQDINIYFSGTTDQVTWATVTVPADYTNYVITLSPDTHGTFLIDFVVTLSDYPSVSSLTVSNYEVQVVCPTDPLLLPIPVAIISRPLQSTIFTYDVTSGETLTVSLPLIGFDPPCYTILYKQVIRVDTQASGTYIELDGAGDSIMHVYTLDDYSALAGSTVPYRYEAVVDYGTEGTIFEIALFEIVYTFTEEEAVLSGPYFDPPLTKIIQIYREAQNGQTWTFVMPKILNSHGEEDDSIQLAVDFGKIGLFMSLQEGDLFIQNLDDPRITSGRKVIMFSLVEDGIIVYSKEVLVYMHGFKGPAVEQPSFEEESPYVVSKPQIEQTGPILSEIQQMVVDYRALGVANEDEVLKSGVSKKNPKAKVDFISQYGEVQIGFDQTMQKVQDFRMLTEGTVFYAGRDVPVLQVDVIPNTESNPEHMKFQWEVAEQKSRMIKFQLRFESAEHVSGGKNSDVLRMTFYDPYMFMGFNNLPVQPDKTQEQRRMRQLMVDVPDEDSKLLVIEQELPSQLPLGGAEETLQQVFTTMLQTTEILVFGTMGVNLFLGAALNKLWSMINIQQIMVMLPLFYIKMPANASLVFFQIMQIAAFSFYDFGNIIHNTFGVPETEPVDENFESVGIESQYLLVNMGTMICFFLLQILLLLLSALFTPMVDKKWIPCKCLKKRIKKLNKNIYWNSLITLMNETYMILVIGVFLNLRIIDFETSGTKGMSAVTILFLMFMIVAPILFLFQLFKNYRKLHQSHWVTGYGSLTDKLNLKKGRYVLLEPTFFLLRRLLLGYVVVFSKKRLFEQMLIVQASSLTMIGLYGAKVLRDRSATLSEYFNEACLLLLSYTVLCYTPWISDYAIRYMIGYASISCVLLQLIVSLYVILRHSFKAQSFKLKFYCIKRGLRKQRKELRVKLDNTHDKRIQRLILLRSQDMLNDQSASLYISNEESSHVSKSMYSDYQLQSKLNSRSMNSSMMEHSVDNSLKFDKIIHRSQSSMLDLSQLSDHTPQAWQSNKAHAYEDYESKLKAFVKDFDQEEEVKYEDRELMSQGFGAHRNQITDDVTDGDDFSHKQPIEVYGYWEPPAELVQTYLPQIQAAHEQYNDSQLGHSHSGNPSSQSFAYRDWPKLHQPIEQQRLESKTLQFADINATQAFNLSQTPTYSAHAANNSYTSVVAPLSSNNQGRVFAEESLVSQHARGYPNRQSYGSLIMPQNQALLSEQHTPMTHYEPENSPRVRRRRIAFAQNLR